MADLWDEQDNYWRTNYNTRPYASGRSYDDLRSGYRYGYDAAGRYQGRSWDDVESDLSRDWNSYEHRGQSSRRNTAHTSSRGEIGRLRRGEALDHLVR